MILVIEGRTTSTRSLQRVDQASYQRKWSGQRSAAFWCAENDPNKLLISHHLPKHQSDHMQKNVDTCTPKLVVWGVFKLENGQKMVKIVLTSPFHKKVRDTIDLAPTLQLP